MPTIEQLAGRPREMPVAIYQDSETLDRIAQGLIESGQFEYDLENPEFMLYLKARGVLYSAGMYKSEWWAWCAQPQARSFEEFRTVPEFKFKRSPDGADPEEFERHEQEYHWQRLKRTWARLADGWELFQADRQRQAEAQRLIDEARSYGVEFERHGEGVDIKGDFPKGTWKPWKSAYNEVFRDFLRLLPDLDSLMQEPEGFVEVSPGNFAHEDDLPSVRAMIAMTEPPSPDKPELFRPANNTEAEAFMDDHCFKCTKWIKAECDIQSLTMVFGTDHPEYPREWIYTENGGATCTAFEPLPPATELAPETKTEPIPEQPAKKKRTSKPVRVGWVQVDLFGDIP